MISKTTATEEKAILRVLFKGEPKKNENGASLKKILLIFTDYGTKCIKINQENFQDSFAFQRVFKNEEVDEKGASGLKLKIEKLESLLVMAEFSDRGSEIIEATIPKIEKSKEYYLFLNFSKQKIEAKFEEKPQQQPLPQTIEVNPINQQTFQLGLSLISQKTNIPEEILKLAIQYMQAGNLQELNELLTGEDLEKLQSLFQNNLKFL